MKGVIDLDELIKKEIEVFGRNIRRARENKNKSLLWLSEKAVYNRNSLSTLEEGEHDLLLSTAISIARALDIDFAELLSRNCDFDNSKFQDENIYSIFSSNVKRKMNHRTQSYFHSIINIEAPNVNRIINMKIKDPKLGTLLKLAKVLEENNIKSMFKRKE
jgi:transcriptional regulator with XRE-family HTH domain